MSDDSTDSSTIENLLRRHVEGAGIDLLRTTPAKGDLPYTVVVDIPAAMWIDDAVTVFRSCGPILRRHVADTPGGWAWAVLAMRDLQPIGVHWGGWDGRDDAWVAKPPRAEGSESMEWRRVYDAVREHLAPLGRDDAFGDGEYWVVEEDYGSREQIVCVFKLDFATPALFEMLREFLGGAFPDWAIVLKLELDPPDSDVVMKAVSITAHRIVEHWDREAMRRRFGARFKA
ncbi:MAG: hypothetical protein IPK81_09655 [Rhodospirillales bacterium]|nr:MAG: hypothetical protein IPK81_09655 [Rhodospirillales bacterium]